MEKEVILSTNEISILHPSEQESQHPSVLPARLEPIGEAIRKTFDSLQNNFKTIFLILVLPTVSAELLSMESTANSLSFNSGAWSLIGIIATVFFTAVGSTALILFFARPEKQYTWLEAYSAAQPYVLKVAIVSILAGAAIVFGFIFLIIPGLLFLVWLSLSQYVIILEKLKPLAALSRSKALTRGFYWQLLGRIICIGFVFFALYFITGIISSFIPQGNLSYLLDAALSTLSGIITTAFTVIFMYRIYLQLYRLRSALDHNTSET